MLILVSGLILSGLWAAEPNLSYNQAKELLLQNNYEYKAAQADLEAARWSKNAAMGSFLPNLSLSGTLLYMDPAQTVTAGASQIQLNNDFRSMTLSLSQPVFTGGKLWQAYKMAGVGVEMTQLALKSKELSLLSELESAYLGVLQSMDLLEMTRLDYQSAELNLEIAAVKRDAGLISSGEYLRFESNKASKEVSLLQAESAFSLAQISLKNLLGIDYLPVPEGFGDASEDPELALLIGFDAQATKAMAQRAMLEAISYNPALKIAGRGVELSRRAYQLSKGSFLPTVMITGSSQYSENGIDRWDFEAQNQIMLNVSVPILPQYTNYSSMRKAYFDLQKSRLEESSAHDGIITGLEASVLGLVSSAKQVRASSLALDYAEQTYEQMLQRYRLDMLSSAELLDLELMLSAARMSYTNSIYNYYKARASLKQMMGDYSTERFVQLINVDFSKEMGD